LKLILFDLRDYRSRIGHPEQSEFTVVKVEFYNDLSAYLSLLADNKNNIHSLEDVIAYNRKHTKDEGGVPGTHPAWVTGQDSFEMSGATKGVKTDTYYKALNYIRQKSREEGIDAALKYGQLELDGLLVPIHANGGVACQLAAKAGMPQACPCNIA
jgi:amidase